MNWLRLWTKILDDEQLQTMEPGLFRFLINLWALARECDGKLPSQAKIAWRFRVTEQIVADSVTALVTMGLLIIDTSTVTPTITPRNWKKWQYLGDSSKERTKRYRNKLSPVTPPVTPTVTPTVTVTHSEQNRTEQTLTPLPPTQGEAAPPLVRDSPPAASQQAKNSLNSAQQSWFDSWWEIVWAKVGQGAAKKAFAVKVRDSQTFHAVIDATKKQTPYFRQRESRYQPHPSTWLNAERWCDDIAAVSGAKPDPHDELPLFDPSTIPRRTQ